VATTSTGPSPSKQNVPFKVLTMFIERDDACDSGHQFPSRNGIIPNAMPIMANASNIN
jgi:hypothetical protein